MLLEGCQTAKWITIPRRLLLSVGILVSILFCLVIPFGVLAKEGMGDQVYTFHITERNAADALNQFARQSGAVLLYRYMTVKDKTVNPVVGRYPMIEALQILLLESGLASGLTDKGAIQIIVVRKTEDGLDKLHSEACLEVDSGSRDNVVVSSNNKGFRFMQDNKCRRRGLIPALAAALTAGASIAANAEEGQVRPYGIDEIVVTAQKRKQNIQDVPISMTAIQGESLLDFQISGLDGLSGTLPNVHISQSTSSNNIYMRGVGSGNSPGFEQAIAIFVDGSYRGRSRYSASSLVDVERVEVLRGPQTTYFGNNAIGGAFSVTTKGPSLDAWEGYGQVSHEFVGDEPAVEAAVGGPLVGETFGIRFAGRYSDLDGWIDNKGSRKKDPSVTDRFGRLSALWKISDDWAASFKAEHGKQTSDGAFAAQLINCPSADFSPSGSCLAALANNQEDKLDFKRTSNGGERGNIEASEFIAKLERESTNGHGYVLQATHSKGDFVTSGDTDVTTADRTTFSNIEANEQTSFEVRLMSPDESRLQYMAGAYYLDSDYDYEGNFNLLSLSPAFVGFLSTLPGLGFAAAAAPYAPFTIEGNITSKEKAYSLFGSATWPFTDTLSGTLGIRYVNSDKSAVQHARPATTVDRYGFITLPIPADGLAAVELLTQTLTHFTNGKVKDDDILPSVIFNFELLENANLYAKFSEGFKAGGFDPQELTGNPARLTYGPENVHAYEVGLKSIWLDNTLAFNIALYRSNYKDLQQAIVQFPPSGAAFVVTTNVGKLVSQGAEIQIVWRASENWEFSTDFAIMDAYYKDYANARCTVLQAAVIGPNCTQDLSDEAPPYAPTYSGTVGVKYQQPINSYLNFTGDLTFSFSDDYSLMPDGDPNGEQDAWQKVGLRLGLSSMDERWNVALVGKNLGNEKVYATKSNLAGTQGSYFATIERGRSVALQFRYNWN